MKRLAFFAVFCGACVMGVAGPVQQWGRPLVKSVHIYPAGVYVTMSVTASLKGVPQERVIFPDLWYVDRETVEIRLTPGEQNEGVTFVPEVSPAVSAKNTNIYRSSASQRDVKLEVLGRIRSDSMALAQEMSFLTSKTYQSWKSLNRTRKAGKWLKGELPDLYEKYRRVKEEIAEQRERLVQIEHDMTWADKHFGDATLAWVWVDAPGPREVEFEVSYYANAAQWEPVYFFRFDPQRGKGELDYQARIRQWTGFNWDSIPATLGYGYPLRAPERGMLYRRTVSYQPPLPPGAKQDRQLGFATNVMPTPADVSYRLAEPLSLAYSTDNGQVYRTVQVRRDTLAVSYGYEVVPGVSDQVILMAYIPDWQRLYLTDGHMNIFYEGRMLGQSNLSVRSTEDTLSVPLTVEPLVVVSRREAADYKEKAEGKMAERKRAYEITLKNNKEFPVSLTVKDQYPVSNTDEAAVTLTEASGASVNPETGMLTWRLELMPGQEQTLRVAYTVRYPAEGTITGYY